ncbi:metallophosphoesterase [Nocardioides sp. KIGAM211]|uniref:Metallophosphoesterase n=1 Tax=Nocardioides luti TaxID=2761101 RepID=A0A7X0RII8_9ACTN|nr:metallophosphoesterase [Nocardioides luti]MBB6628941.1 metallophosphoesterase [Nocardioides luti]
MRITPLPLLATTSVALAAGLAVAVPADAGSPHGAPTPPAYSFAVIGDLPYGADQIARFPGWIQQINADPAVRAVLHAGDIKNGSSVCSDDYFAMIRSNFDTFEDPLVYTPGDNEWTDCHRANNGAYDPLERLAKVREVFFDQPGTTLGQHPLEVASQARRGFPENVVLHQAGLSIAAVNVTGSNNGLQPWTGLGKTEPTPEQSAAVRDRVRNDVVTLHRAFQEARSRHDRGVVLLQQADMFDPTYTPTENDISAFRPWVQALAAEAARYHGPVYLFDGDSHVYNADRPLATGSSWLTTYGVKRAADNLTRVTVDGSSNNNDYLRVTVNQDPSGDLLTWERVPYTS